jgi:membrane-bound lytic murein transglycosylase B
MLQSIEQRYGVDRQVLVSVWGMESNFGQFQGNKSVIRSLATLAYEGRRPGSPRPTDRRAADPAARRHQPEKMLGSWAGAMGQTQFIPTTYNTHAVDFDGDGRRDIWNSQPTPWPRPRTTCKAPAGSVASRGASKCRCRQLRLLADGAIRKTSPNGATGRDTAQWRAGTGRQEQLSAALLLPAGYRGPAFLVLDNFRAILKYNNSSSYALAVSLLSSASMVRA